MYIIGIGMPFINKITGSNETELILSFILRFGFCDCIIVSKDCVERFISARKLKSIYSHYLSSCNL